MAARFLPNGYHRRPTRTLRVGRVGIGSDYPICLQSMTTTRARDVEKSVIQVKELVSAGAGLVRITTPQLEDAYALPRIVGCLADAGVDVPIVADVHFSPDVALEAARHVSKVRINPGNYSDAQIAETAAQYSAALDSMRQRMGHLFEVCKQHAASLRIGVNHGSLAPRVVHRHGAGPQGMVASALEVVEIAHAYGFHSLVLSLKASDPRVMIFANRLLAQALDERGWPYPIHLGVTEAGAGEDARVKSAIGIGTLLADGIGDTIRVSLTESPVAELPVCREIVAHAARWAGASSGSGDAALFHYDPLHPIRRDISLCPPLRASGALLLASVQDAETLRCILQAEVAGAVPFDFILCNGRMTGGLDCSLTETARMRIAEAVGEDGWRVQATDLRIARLAVPQLLQSDSLEELHLEDAAMLMLVDAELGPWSVRRAVDRLATLGVRLPVVLCKTHLSECGAESLSIVSAMELGAPLVDNLVEGILFSVTSGSAEAIRQLGFGILQATGLRRVRADYIACPGCGRTLFDLQGTLARVQAATQHLRHLRIGVMGCIVNGPGEMADADYGYVGAGPGRITLYKGQLPMLKAIPEANAIEALINLMKQHGDWYEAV